MDEKRRNSREDVFTTIMISPNGHENKATVYNVSESGARVGLPSDFKRNVGAPVRLFFTVDEDQTIILDAQVVRVAVDHLGVEFSPRQEDDIRHVMSEFSGSR
jgi:hypothetical protein